MSRLGYILKCLAGSAYENKEYPMARLLRFLPYWQPLYSAHARLRRPRRSLIPKFANVRPRLIAAS